MTRALCRRLINSCISRATKFGDTATAEQKKTSTKDEDRATVIGMQSLCKISTLSGLKATRGEQKPHKERCGTHRNFSIRNPVQRWHFSANLLEFENLVKISDGIIARLSLIDPRPVVSQKGQCVVSKKRHQLSFCCRDSMNTVGRRFCGELPAISAMLKASYQTAKVHVKGDSGNFGLGQQDLSFKECTKDQMRLHQFGNNVFCGISMRYALFAREIGRESCSLQTLRNRKRIKSTSSKFSSHKKENFHSRAQMAQLREAGKGHEVRTSDQLRQDSEREEQHHIKLHRETDDPDPAEQQEQYNLVARHCIWNISENHMRHHVQESVKIFWWTKR